MYLFGNEGFGSHIVTLLRSQLSIYHFYYHVSYSAGARQALEHRPSVRYECCLGVGELRLRLLVETVGCTEAKRGEGLCLFCVAAAAAVAGLTFSLFTRYLTHTPQHAQFTRTSHTLSFSPYGNTPLPNSSPPPLSSFSLPLLLGAPEKVPAAQKF